MILHFMSCPPSFKPQITTTRAQLSQTSHSVKPTSLPTANKWKIDQENHSIAFTNHDDLRINHEEKLKEFKHILRNLGENSWKGLHLIDALQRLNLDYHFQEEIDTFLRRQYVVSSTDYGGGSGHNLHDTSLRFRLLRQQGQYIPTEVFGKFTNKEGEFNLKLSDDIKGMMGLHEASQLSIAGEDILDEAGIFSGKVLKDKAAYLDFREAELVRNTLEQPFHKSLPMFTSRNLFGDFHDKNGWLNALQEVAKIDFSLLQSVHQNEILQISKWWADLGLANELKCARNQPLKWYVWSLACLTNPSFSDQRIELTKPIAFIYLIDDIFDVYGTLDELTLFTEAVTRWDINATEHLPEYMRICFKALYDLTNEISCKVYEKHGWNPNDSLRRSWASLCKAFLVEAEWFASGHMPKAEEYLENGIVSSGVHIVLVHVFFLLGEGITKEKVQMLDRMPGIISSPATILRLWDDLGSAEDENQEGNDGSYVQCFIKDNTDCSLKKTREEVMRKISDAWKSLNEECLFQNPFPAAFTKSSLNLARLVPLMYSYDDNKCLPKLEDQVNSLLYDTVLL